MKYHICREKMQLSRAKPGNPASIIYTIYNVKYSVFIIYNIIYYVYIIYNIFI